MKKNSEGKSTAAQKTRELGLRFFSNAGIYALGSIFMKLGSLLVLPFYWQVLSPEDFGRIAIAQIIIQFLASFLDLGISGSIQRHYFEWSAKDRPHHLSAVWMFSLLFSGAVCISLYFLTPFLDTLFEVGDSKDLIVYGIWIAFFQNFGLLPFSLTRIKEQLSLFYMLSLGQFLVQSVAILICIFPLKMGYHGFLLGTLLGSIFYAIVSLIYIFKQIQFPFTWEHLREPLAYALPTAPAAILEGSASVLDRFFLQKFIGLEELGIYSLARQFGMAYNFFVSTLKNSWVPLVYRMVAERADASKVLSRLATYYLFFLSISALAVAVLAPELVLWIGKQEYFGMAPYIPYFVLAYVFSGIGNIFGRGLDLAKKTQYYWIVYAVNFSVNLGLLWILAPRYGVWGAISAFLIAGICREGVLIGLANHFYPRKNDWVSILKILLPNLATFFLLQQVETSLILSSVVKVIGLAVCALGCAYWLFGKKGFETVKLAVLRRLKIFEIPKN